MARIKQRTTHKNHQAAILKGQLTAMQNEKKTRNKHDTHLLSSLTNLNINHPPPPLPSSNHFQ